MVRKNFSISSGLSRGNSRSLCFFGLGGRCFCWGGLITVIGAGRGSARATVDAVKAVSGSPPSVLFTNRRTLVSLMMVVSCQKLERERWQVELKEPSVTV